MIFPVEFDARNDVQLLVMELISDVVVALSAMTWSVVFPLDELKGAVVSAPPGRVLFDASPYCRKKCC